MPQVPCLICKALTRNRSRCNTCQAAYAQRVDRRRGTATQRGYGPEWRAITSSILSAHRRAYGDMCPGWRRPPHPARDLTVDHRVPKHHGGGDDVGNLQVLCRRCNSSKGSVVRGKGGTPTISG